jgi:hypothetical protein
MKRVSAQAILGVLVAAVLCTAVRIDAAESLPGVFLSVLGGLKGKTKVDVLLPTELPRPFSDGKHANVDKATADEYAVSLHYELDAGNAGFAASFGATNNPRYSLKELANVREVKLAAGITGFFRPVNCGGSCAPANLWWRKGSVQYQIQLKLSSTLREEDQQGTMTTVANSAILAGPR